MPLKNQISSASILEMQNKFAPGLKVSPKSIAVCSTAVSQGHVGAEILSCQSGLLCFSHSGTQKPATDQSSHELPPFQTSAPLLGAPSAALASSTGCIYWA